MAVDFDRVVFAIAEYRKTDPIQDAGILDLDPLSTELEFVTLLENEADAEVFGGQILELRRYTGRNDWSLSIRKDSLQCEIGDTIKLYYNRFGLELGKDFIVKRIKRSQGSNFDEFTLFGPRQTMDYVPGADTTFDSTLIRFDSTYDSWDVDLPIYPSLYSFDLSGIEFDNSTADWSH